MKRKQSWAVSLVAITVALAGCGTLQEWFGNSAKLSGAQEVPPVTTAAAGRSTITVNDDRSLSGSVKVWDMKPTGAHIHQGSPGQNGPVIIPLTQSPDSTPTDATFEPPATAKLTDAQYKAYQTGNLYVNVHSAAHPNGEVRAQLVP